MPHIIVNAGPDGLIYDATALRAALAALPLSAPIVILIHGYKYAPGAPERCPHHNILAPSGSRKSWKVMSWPRHLRLGDDALVIAFGWQATGLIWGAYRRAGRAGKALGKFIGTLGRPANLMGHSLGARVALSAMMQAPAGSISKLVLVAGAALRAQGRAAMASPAGRWAQVLNVTSRENLAFDLVFTALLGGQGRALGAGLKDLDGWTDLSVDHAATRLRLARLGHRIPAPTHRICHWSLYLRPGLVPLYGAVLRGDVPIAWLVGPQAEPNAAFPFAFITSRH